MVILHLRVVLLCIAYHITYLGFLGSPLGPLAFDGLGWLLLVGLDLGALVCLVCIKWSGYYLFLTRGVVLLSLSILINPSTASRDGQVRLAWTALGWIGVVLDFVVAVNLVTQHIRVKPVPPDSFPCSSPPLSVKVETADLPDTECSICLESIGNAYARLPCGHVFHLRCAELWHARGSETCALCRQPSF